MSSNSPYVPLIGMECFSHLSMYNCIFIHSANYCGDGQLALPLLVFVIKFFMIHRLVIRFKFLTEEFCYCWRQKFCHHVSVKFTTRTGNLRINSPDYFLIIKDVCWKKGAVLGKVRQDDAGQ